MTMTKAELRARVERELDDYLDVATVAKLTQLETFLTEEYPDSGPPTLIRFKDRHLNHTEFNLEAGTWTSRAMARTDQPECCTVEGTGPRLTIDMATMYFYGGDVLEFDPMPDVRPVAFSFDDPDAPEPTPLEEEAEPEPEAEPETEPEAEPEEDAPLVTVREEETDVHPVRS